jgi:hypothetical protein
MPRHTIIVDASSDVVVAALQRLGMVTVDSTADHLSMPRLADGISAIGSLGERRTRIRVTDEDGAQVSRLAHRLRGFGFRVVEDVDGAAGPPRRHPS